MRRFLLTVIAALVLPGGAMAAPKIKQPSCDALATWGAHVNAENYNVAPRLQLPKALEDAQVVPLFGASVLTWTPEDLQSANQILTKCWNEARARRDGTAANEFVNANRALQGLVPRVNATLHKATADAEPLEQKLAGLPDSPALDRGLAAFLKINPAQPDVGPLRMLPPEIADPLIRLAAQVLPVLANDQREKLFKALGDRHAKMQAGIASAAEKSIASAAEDADGVVALIAAGPQIAAVDDANARAQLQKAAGEKSQKIRAALRQAKPAVWVPPDCLDLYRWSSAPDAGSAVNVGDRQEGRLRFGRVFDVPVDAGAIEAGLRQAIDSGRAAPGSAGYPAGPAAPRIVEALASWRVPRPPRKRFHEVAE